MTDHTSTITPSDAQAMKALSAACVHCGFCLAACPTYAVTGMENDSPRGRIWLLTDAASRGELSLKVRTHIDRCIGCEACVPACPSGVRYDQLIDIARRVVNDGRSPAVGVARAVVTTAFAGAAKVGSLVAPTQAVARWSTRAPLMRRSLTRFGSLNAVMQQAATIHPQAHLALDTSLVANERGRVVLLTGCISSVLFGEVNTATVRVLNAEGISVIVPREQGCCGALESHAGRHQAAKRRATHLIKALKVPGVDAVVTNSAGCGAMMKGYGDLLDGDVDAVRFAGSVLDVMEYLSRFESIAHYGEMERSVLYHDPCHLAFAQGIHAEPLAVLERIPGLKVELAGGPNCCGAGGLYSIMQPELAREIGEAKRDAILATKINLIVSGNPGCAIQLSSLLAEQAEVVHPVSLLAQALAP